MHIDAIKKMSGRQLNNLAILLGWMHSKLLVTDDFLTRFSSDDDWTFIIKLHAMIEAGLNHMLLKQFNNEELSKVIARLETSNPKTGKLAFIKAFKILPEEYILFIRNLSEIRNFCVHDPKNFSYNLKEDVGSYEEKKKKQWIKFVTFMVEPCIQLETHGLSLADAAVSNPRNAVFVTSINIMFQALWHHGNRGKPPGESPPPSQPTPKKP